MSRKRKSRNVADARQISADLHIGSDKAASHQPPLDPSPPSRMRWLLGILVTAIVMLLVSVSLRRMTPKDFHRVRLDSVAGDLDVGLVGRSVILLPQGECVIFNYSATSVSESEPHLKGFLESGRTKKHLDPVGTYWGDRQLHPQTLSTFNCATYAVGECIGLTERDWLSTEPTGATFYTTPLEIVLNSYYRQIQSASGPDGESGDESHKLLASAQAGDVVSFHDGTESASRIVHVGTVQHTDGQQWIISKLGNGPIVRASLSDTVEFYRHDGAVHQLQLYRRHH